MDDVAWVGSRSNVMTLSASRRAVFGKLNLLTVATKTSGLHDSSAHYGRSVPVLSMDSLK
jgi:hypothetical protein